MLPIQASVKRSVFHSALKLKSSQRTLKTHRVILKSESAVHKTKEEAILRAIECAKNIRLQINSYFREREISIQRGLAPPPLVQSGTPKEVCNEALKELVDGLNEATDTTGYSYISLLSQIDRLFTNSAIPQFNNIRGTQTEYPRYQSYQNSLSELKDILKIDLPSLDPSVNS